MRKLLPLVLVLFASQVFGETKEIEEEEAFEVSIGVIGTNEGNAALEDMAVRFKVGE